jgi:hypothetical protein
VTRTQNLFSSLFPPPLSLPRVSTF